MLKIGLAPRTGIKGDETNKKAVGLTPTAFSYFQFKVSFYSRSADCPSFMLAAAM